MVRCPFYKDYSGSQERVIEGVEGQVLGDLLGFYCMDPSVINCPACVGYSSSREKRTDFVVLSFQQMLEEGENISLNYYLEIHKKWKLYILIMGFR